MVPQGPTICPACNGAKVQTRADGVRIICPACHGTGTYHPPGTIIYEAKTWSGGSDTGAIKRLS